ncbi:MAG: hypothetical protein H7Y89_09330 [Steroidobacteraceae bacterium]|nr:hypothetical protein [Steroidobacteraceae bacterium]
MNVALRDLTPAERSEVQQRFETLASARFAPSTKRPRFEVWWPKAPLDGRALPEGIHPLNVDDKGDDNFNEAARLVGFLNSVSPGEFYIANLSAPKPHFRHTGRLDDDLCQWIKTRLVSNPTCLLSAVNDVFIIVDTQMRYSVLGGPSDVIDKFEKRFGGAEALRQTFSSFVDQMRIGNGIEDVKWAQDYLQRWSGWA